MKIKLFFICVFCILLLFTCKVVMDTTINSPVDPATPAENYMRYYKFNSSLEDFSSNQVAATYMGSSLEYTENRFGETGNAIKFSGDDGLTTNLNSLKGDFTISFWFKVDIILQGGIQYPLVTKHTDPARGDAGLEFGLFLWRTAAGADFLFKMGSGNDTGNPPTGMHFTTSVQGYTRGRWFFVAVELSDNQATIYQGDDTGKWGEVKKSPIFNYGKRQLGTNSVMIGRFDNKLSAAAPLSTTYFRGDIDSFIIWDATLFNKTNNREKTVKDIYQFAADPSFRFDLNTDFTQFGREAVIDYGKIKLKGDEETLYDVNLTELNYNADIEKYFITVPDGFDFYTFNIKREGYDEYLEDFHVSELQEYIEQPDKIFTVAAGKWTPQLAPVRVTGVAQNSVSLEWTPPAGESNLDYLVFISSADNLQTVGSALRNTELSYNFITDNNCTITGLTEAKTYYYNVVARRNKVQKALYMGTASVIPDGTPPVPGNSGIINVDSVDYASCTIKLSWAQATDNVAPQEKIAYRLYHSVVPYSSLSDVLNNATPMGNFAVYQPDIPLITRVPEGSNFFYVVVKDLAGYMALYKRVQEYFTPKLVAYYKLDNGNAVDSGGNQNHGIPQGTFQEATDRYGNIHGSLLFAGASYIDTPITSLTGDYTVSLWMYMVSPEEQVPRPFISKHTIDGAADRFAEFDFGIYYFDYGSFFMGNGASSDYGVGLFTLNQVNNPPLPEPPGPYWRHMAVTVSGNTARLFLNGKLQEEAVFFTSDGGSRQSGYLPIQIGRYANDEGEIFYKGMLDDIRIFGSALTNSDIINLYNMEKPVRN